MSGTAETDAILLGQFADNTSGSILEAFARDLIVSKLNVLPSVVSAAGTTQGTATVLTAHLNVITTCAAGAGVRATSLFTQIWNFSANACLVYPISGAAFNSQATDTPITVAVGSMATCVMTSPTQGYAL